MDNMDLISSYSRSDAIEDGVLFDITKLAFEAGFKFPVAVTSAVQDRLDFNEHGQSLTGRTWDMLNVLLFAIRKNRGGSQVNFTVAFENEEGKLTDQKLKAVVSGGDQGEAVITIMFPNED